MERIQINGPRRALGGTSTNTIIHVAIHDLIRDGSEYKVKFGNDALKITRTTQRVIDSLYDLYSKRASKSHGNFSLDKDNLPTEKHIKDYYDGKYKDFSNLTHKMMETLKLQARLKAASSGGHVFFAHFKHDARDFLLVTIVNDKIGAGLTNEVEVEDVPYLDLDGFRFAGRINISGWVANDERYISFLKGKGEVSEYFKLFLGCDASVQDRKDTTDLVNALKGFAEQQRMDPASKEDFLRRAKNICASFAKAKEPIAFEVLANELLPLTPEILVEALAQPDLKLNDGFIPQLQALGPLVRLKGGTPFWKVEIERDALVEGKVVYDYENNTLTLKDIPSEMRGELTYQVVDDE